jgi:hypothetical protein
MRHTFEVAVEIDADGNPEFFILDKDISADDFLGEVQAAVALMDTLGARTEISESVA